MEYNWNTLNVEVYNSLNENTDVVYKVNYGILTSKNGNGVTLFKEQELDISSITEFIPFEDLTDDIVIGWVKSYLGDSGVVAVEKEADELFLKTSNTSIKTLKYD